MDIFLDSEALDVAIKEYMAKRGMDPEKFIKATFKAGRRGNPSSAVVQVSGFGSVIDVAPAPPIYAAQNAELDKEVEEVQDTVQELESHFQEPALTSNVTPFGTLEPVTVEPTAENMVKFAVPEEVIPESIEEEATTSYNPFS